MPRLRTCLTGFLLTVIALTTSAAAPSTAKVVRIGWYPDLYNCISTNGIKKGYVYDYAQTVASYTGWTCKQLLTKVRSFIVTVLSRRLNIRLVLLQPLRHQLISQTEQVPTRI